MRLLQKRVRTSRVLAGIVFVSIAMSYRVDAIWTWANAQTEAASGDVTDILPAGAYAALVRDVLYRATGTDIGLSRSSPVALIQSDSMKQLFPEYFFVDVKLELAESGRAVGLHSVWAVPRGGGSVWCFDESELIGDFLASAKIRIVTADDALVVKEVVHRFTRLRPDFGKENRQIGDFQWQLGRWKIPSGEIKCFELNLDESKAVESGAFVSGVERFDGEEKK